MKKNRPINYTIMSRQSASAEEQTYPQDTVQQPEETSNQREMIPADTNTETTDTNTKTADINTKAAETNTETADINTKAAETNTETADINTQTADTNNTETADINTETVDINTETAHTNTEETDNPPIETIQCDHEIMATGFSLPKFNGSGNPVIWIAKLDTWQKFNNYDDQKILDLLPCALEGSASTWYQTMSPCNSLATFKQLLIERFQSIVYRMPLMGIRQDTSETLDQYPERAERIGMAHDIVEHYKVQAAASGLKNQWRGKSLARKAKKCQELVNAVSNTQMELSELQNQSAPQTSTSFASLSNMFTMLATKMTDLDNIIETEINALHVISQPSQQQRCNNQHDRRPQFQQRRQNDDRPNEQQSFRCKGCENIEEASTIPQTKESFSKETKLHIAVKDQFYNLLEIGFAEEGNSASEVNTRNRWGQTPLHYAAAKKIFPQNLLSIPNCDPRIQDINGYNVLHSYICNIFEHDDWKRVIKILLSFDIDINQKTSRGNTVLHLACRYRTPSCVLRYMLETFPQVDMMTVNDDRENFLHTLMQSLNSENQILDSYKNKVALLDDIVSKHIPLVSSNILKILLQQQDMNGATPFLLLLSNFEKYRKVDAIDVLKKMSSLSDCSTIPDFLGNYPIHIAFACSENVTPIDLLNTLVNLGNSADSKNIFQQSVAHLIRIQERNGPTSDEKIKSLLNLEKAAKVDFNCRDRWLSTPLMYISVWCDSHCLDTLNELSDKFSDIDARDENGATALHYAAYHDKAEFAQWLLNKGAKTEIQDKLEDTPLDTARRHYSYRTEELLLKSIGFRGINDINKRFLLNLERIRQMQPVQYNELDEFVDQLLHHMYRKVSDEDNSIISTIRYFVGMLCSKVEEYDPRFRMSVLQSGSSSEGTKAGPPDEFDFLLCLDALSEISEIFQTTSKENYRNICLKLKEAENCEFLEYFDENGTFTTLTAFMHLKRYLQRAVQEPNIWQTEKLRNLCYVFEQPLLKKTMHTTVFMIHLTWMGCQHKHMQIKIDLVPVIRKPAWWPMDPYSLPLMSPEIHDAGCLLMLDTKDDSGEFTSDFNMETNLNEFTMDNINRLEPISTSLLVSTAPAEIRLMQSLPKRIRESYVAAKLFVNFCREEDIKSYILKNCTFYVLQDLGWDPNNPEEFDTDLTVRELTILIFKKFLKFNKEGRLPRFFLPEIDIFLENDDRRHRRRGAYSLLIIMGDEDSSLDKLVYESEGYEDSEDSDTSDCDSSDYDLSDIVFSKSD